MTGIKHILVIRFSAMGDVAMTVPVIKTLLEQNPETQVTYVSRPAFAAFFDNIPRLTYIAADLDKDYNGLGGIVKLFRELNTRSYDALADLHNNLRSKILRRLFRLSGLTYAYIDKCRSEKKQLTRFPGKVLKPLKLTTERYADVFRKLGFQLVLEHRLIKQPVQLTDELVAIAGKKTRQWIGISPFAKHKGKIYPLERMEEVISSLNKRDITIFLFGGNSIEEEICRQWEAKYSKAVSLVNRLTMQQELMLISQLDVMLSMDSAGMHLASLEGVPVVSVWGATHHYAGFLGYGQSQSNIVADDIECRPCSVYGDKPCFRKDYACLYNITPATIITSLNKFIPEI
jgi:ADP-heptose:LPS heptosyltransferase